MPRPRKDQELRRNEFIVAAKDLFFTKGYKSVSINDILLSVGKKSESPSVFYYYFDSKQDIYEAVMENYCDDYLNLMESCFSDNSISIEQKFINSIELMSKTMNDSKNNINGGDIEDNRLFILDLRDRTTRKISKMLSDSLIKYPLLGKSDEQKRIMSLYITGGISEIIYNIIFTSYELDIDINKLMNEILQFSAKVIGVPQSVLKILLKRI